MTETHGDAMWRTDGSPRGNLATPHAPYVREVEVRLQAAHLTTHTTVWAEYHGICSAHMLIPASGGGRTVELTWTQRTGWSSATASHRDFVAWRLPILAAPRAVVTAVQALRAGSHPAPVREEWEYRGLYATALGRLDVIAALEAEGWRHTTDSDRPVRLEHPAGCVWGLRENHDPVWPSGDWSDSYLSAPPWRAAISWRTPVDVVLALCRAAAVTSTQSAPRPDTAGDHGTRLTGPGWLIDLDAATPANVLHAAAVNGARDSHRPCEALAYTEHTRNRRPAP